MAKVNQKLTSLVTAAVISGVNMPLQVVITAKAHQNHSRPNVEHSR